jgi:hypothetical protein
MKYALGNLFERSNIVPLGGKPATRPLSARQFIARMPDNLGTVTFHLPCGSPSGFYQCTVSKNLHLYYPSEAVILFTISHADPSDNALLFSTTPDRYPVCLDDYTYPIKWS